MADKIHVTTRSKPLAQRRLSEEEIRREGKKWGKKETHSGKLTSVFPPARPSERNRKRAAPTALQNSGWAGKKREFFKISRGKAQKDSAEEKISG